MTGQPQLLMRRADLAGLPPIDVPAGYVLRRAVIADAPGLARLLAAAFGDAWDGQRVCDTLLGCAEVKRTYLITHGETVVATASAAERFHLYPQAGYVHWVGTDPQHAGKGLGCLASLAVLHAFAELGYHSAVLETDDNRLPAIRIYRKLGFTPEMTHVSYPARWQAILATPPRVVSGG